MYSQLNCSLEQKFKKKTPPKEKLVSARNARKRRQPDRKQRLPGMKGCENPNEQKAKRNKKHEIPRINGSGLSKGMNSRKLPVR